MRSPDPKKLVELPPGTIRETVRANPIGDGAENVGILVLRPLRMQPNRSIVGNAFPRNFFRPESEIFRTSNDKFQFRGARPIFRKREPFCLGTERNPIDVSANRKRAAGFEMNAEFFSVERSTKRREVVNGRLASRDDDKIRICGSSGVREFRRRHFPDESFSAGAPRSRRIAPRATDRTAEQPDKKRGSPGVHALALKGVKMLEYVVFVHFHNVKFRRIGSRHQASSIK